MARRKQGAPLIEADCSRGIVRDSPRVSIPNGGVYDSTDFLLHQPGLAQKRGGTSYAGPALTSATYAAAVAYAEFPTAAKLVGIGDNGHLYTVASGTTTDVGTMGTAWATKDNPKLRTGGGTSLLVVTANDGQSMPYKYDGSTLAKLGANTQINNVGGYALPAATITVDSTTGFPSSGAFWVLSGSGPQQVAYTGITSTTFTGCTGGTGTAADNAVVSTVPPGRYAEVYKSRLALANVKGFENRIYWSPTPDIENQLGGSGWDSANSYIDADHAVTGLAALQNSLLVFSAGHTERIIGSTPPPGSDMDRAPIGSVGCTDARSIIVQEGNCLFANPRGVYLTNGAGFASLTTEGFVESYWQSLFTSYNPSTWTLAAGVFRSFYFVSIIDNNGSLVASLMCNVPRRAWWRLTNVSPMMFSAAVGASEELYYADRLTNRVTKLAGIFSPTSTNKNDADGTAVAPTLEYRAIGDGTGIKQFGFGHLSYYMADAASDNPSLAVALKTGVRAATASTAPESPLAENTDVERKRFSVFKDSQAVTVKLTQTGASSATEVYALEVEQDALPLVEGGVS